MYWIMVNKPAKGADAPIPQRLRQLRAAEGYETALAFARTLGVAPNRYGNIEAGSNLSIEVAQLIVSKVPGVTLDWLYNGKPDGLTVSLRQRLEGSALGNITTVPTPSRSQSRGARTPKS
jgi:transcriptional regulator with XRE-family HTH domain